MSIKTVLGEIKGEQLGRTLTHEHLYVDYRKHYVTPPVELLPYVKSDVITLQNIGFIQRYPYSNETNINFTDEFAVIQDVKLFKKHGGGSIVENTNHGLNRNIPFMKKVSKETGVHIVAGTGFYLAEDQSVDFLKMTVEDMCKLMKKELLEGSVEDPTVRCGYIGELGTNYPQPSAGDGFELRAIQATGLLQSELKCPVSFHPGRQKEAPFEVMRRFSEAGGDPRKTVMSHLDRTLTADSDLWDFADEFPCFCQFDLFGTEVLTYQFSPHTQMPSDRQRLDRLKQLVDDGKVDRILMSHDIHTRQRLVQYGGHGFMHMLTNILPKMRLMGFTEEQVDQITICNPKKWLTW